MKRVAATVLLAIGLLQGVASSAQEPMSARELERMTMLARRDLANRLRLNVEHVHVAKVEARRWTDDDMNCAGGGGAAVAANAADAGNPEQGAATGYRLELSASGRTYFYHTDLRSVRACPPGQ
jgi:hypothetical protein